MRGSGTHSSHLTKSNTQNQWPLNRSESNLVWPRNSEGVTINLPEKAPCDYSYVFKISPLGA